MEKKKNSTIDELSINSIRMLCAEEIDKAKSGHPGMAIGAAAILHTLYTRIIQATPENNQWYNRDRFVLSAGHGSALIYTILHLCGYKITTDDLKSFRSFGSITPGHPEYGVTPGIDATTGPLGQGVAQGVGLALAEEYLRAKYPNIIDHYTYVLCGDGDIQEGLSQEAFSLAGHLGLSKLIVLYDSNDIQLDGPVDACNSENSKEKYESMGWDYDLVKDGNDCDSIEKAILKAQKNHKPTMIEIKTIIGYGRKNEGTAKVHGAPLPHDEVLEMRKTFGGNAFDIPKEVYAFYQQTFQKRGNASYQKWLENLELCPKEQKEEFNHVMKDDFTIPYDQILTYFSLDCNQPTRKSGGILLKEISQHHLGLIGGSADLASSTMAQCEGEMFTKENRLGRNICFGVREHAMAAICNGMALHQLRPFCSSFFAFSDYLKPAVRMSALSKLPVIYIFSHDSIAVGEDGPTHHPIEHLTMLRSIPNVNVIRPCDANETREAYIIAMQSKTTPTVLVLSRQNLPTIIEKEKTNVSKGAYIVSKENDKTLDGILIASGSEVIVALKTKEILENKGYHIRVVSMPSIYLFQQQSKEYQEEILPSYVSRKMAIEMSEAAHYYSFVGCFGAVYGIQKFGKSAPGPVVIEAYGFKPEKIANEFLKLEKVDFIRYVK